MPDRKATFHPAADAEAQAGQDWYSELQDSMLTVERVRGGQLMEVFPGISMDPKIRFGKPCVIGTRIDVATVLGSLASGSSIEDTESEYELSRAQIVGCLRYAAHVAAHLPPAVEGSGENSPR